ncbi:MAG: hydrogenase maturation nickel metallochaperone HypA [Planctomycetes bacterium]|nr:hydrogenase maturation nickel metallochaperone HypA [Planctomycetota bacterium]
MHEFSICQSLVDAALEEFRRIEPTPERITRVRVVAGRLHQLVPEFLQSAYEVLTKDTPAEGSEMELRLVPVTGRCTACGWEGEIEPPVFQCAGCGAFAIELCGGKELYLDQMEIEER